MNRSLAAIVLALALAPPGRADRIPPHVRQHLSDRVARGHSVAIVVGVVDAEGAEYASAGVRSRDDDAPVDERSIFEIGSITKVFTAALLLDMEQRGLLARDAPLAGLLPSTACVPARGPRPITLLDLATHRSGLPRLPDGFEPADAGNPYADYGEADLLAFLASHELARAPGEAYEYSNLGAGLLGHALARRAGVPYEQLVTDRILAPLGMDDTAIRLSEEQRRRLAQGHVGASPVPLWDFDAMAGAGALRSSARDMVTFLRANLGLVDATPVMALRATHDGRHGTASPEVSVAVGWHVVTRHGRTTLWHDGGTGGYRSFCAFVPAERRGVVVLGSSASEVADIGMHLLDPEVPLRPLRAAVTVSPEALEELVGHYELAPGSVLHVTRDGSQLHAELTGQDRYPVYPESESRFAYEVVEAALEFQRGEDGTVDRLVLHQNGEHVARRVRGYAPPVHVEIPLDPRILERYVGRYELAPEALFDVTLRDGKLLVRLTGQPAFPVFPESETRFFYKVVEAQITFELDAETEKATALVLHQGGVDSRARRISDASTP